MEDGLIPRLQGLQKAIDLEVAFVIKEQEKLSNEQLDNLLMCLKDIVNRNYKNQSKLLEKYN